MPLPILFIGFIILVGLCLDPLLSLGPIGAVLAITIFLVGWFIIWGMGIKDKDEPLKKGVENGMKLLGFAICLFIAVAIIAGILFFINQYSY